MTRLPLHGTLVTMLRFHSKNRPNLVVFHHKEAVLRAPLKRTPTELMAPWILIFRNIIYLSVTATDGGPSMNRKKMDRRRTGRKMYILKQSELHLPFLTEGRDGWEVLKLEAATQVQFVKVWNKDVQNMFKTQFQSQVIILSLSLRVSFRFIFIRIYMQFDFRGI